MKFRWLIVAAVVMLVAAACSSSSSTTTKASESSSSTAASSTTQAEEHEHDENRVIEAPAASITVDGDPADWAAIDGLDVTLEPIAEEEGQGPVDIPATIKVAHDDENVYVLFAIQDDYNWVEGNNHKSASAAIMWRIDPNAGEHMGTDSENGDGPSLGMVDVWHWELGDCPAGAKGGGAVNDAGGGAAGNDGNCNLDDEWASSPTDRDDDNATGAENSLLGVWAHTADEQDAAGTYYFEFSRPLQTGDSQDAQLTVPGEAKFAAAYWDPDTTPDGWDGDHHVMTSNQGWITVEFQS